MNKYILNMAAAAIALTSMTSCIQDFVPEQGVASKDQVEQALTAFNSLTNLMPTTLAILPPC